MKKLFYSFLAFFFSISRIFAEGIINQGDLTNPPEPPGAIQFTDSTLIGVLSLVQGILLKAILPIIVVGTAIYIAYQLFTAEGDEAKMKQAWRSLGYSSIALIVIALSYALISIFANISL